MDVLIEWILILVGRVVGRVIAGLLLDFLLLLLYGLDYRDCLGFAGFFRWCLFQFLRFCCLFGLWDFSIFWLLLYYRLRHLTLITISLLWFHPRFSKVNLYVLNLHMHRYIHVLLILPYCYVLFYLFLLWIHSFNIFLLDPASLTLSLPNNLLPIHHPWVKVIGLHLLLRYAVMWGWYLWGLYGGVGVWGDGWWCQGGLGWLGLE